MWPATANAVAQRWWEQLEGARYPLQPLRAPHQRQSCRGLLYLRENDVPVDIPGCALVPCLPPAPGTEDGTEHTGHSPIASLASALALRGHAVLDGTGHGESSAFCKSLPSWPHRVTLGVSSHHRISLGGL